MNRTTTVLQHQFRSLLYIFHIENAYETLLEVINGRHAREKKHVCVFRRSMHSRVLSKAIPAISSLILCTVEFLHVLLHFHSLQARLYHVNCLHTWERMKDSFVFDLFTYFSFQN